jgi:hypothetical protein
MTGKSAQSGPHPSGLSDDEPAGPFPTMAKQVGSPPLGLGVSSELESKKVPMCLEYISRGLSYFYSPPPLDGVRTPRDSVRSGKEEDYVCSLPTSKHRGSR